MVEVGCWLGWTRIRDRERGRKSGWLHLDDIHGGGIGSGWEMLFRSNRVQ